MLRSLVGSEMCIRDRYVRWSGLSVPLGLAAGSVCILEGKDMLKWLMTACLLYTSDAADDLLCVDLGGRRILKKKNAVQQHMRQFILTHPIPTVALIRCSTSHSQLQ